MYYFNLTPDTINTDEYFKIGKSIWFSCALKCAYYLLGKGGYVFGSVGLSVCRSVGLWTTLLKTI